MKVKVLLSVEMETEISGESIRAHSNELASNIRYAKHLILTTSGSDVKFTNVEWEPSNVEWKQSKEA